MKGKFIAKCLFFGVLCVAGFFALGYVVMTLWNWLMPALFGLHIITFYEAFGLLILSRILFGGFRGHGKRHHGCGCHGGWKGGWRGRWENKWAQMTPEEREKFKRGWGGKCGFGEQTTETKTEG